MKFGIFRKMWKNRGFAAMTLAPMLCFAGCVSASRLNPTVLTTPRGNAVSMTLPRGSEIRIKRNASELTRAFINELRVVSTNSDGSLTLSAEAPLKLATESYMLERDARELFYAEEILKLRSLLQKRQNNNSNADCNGK